MSEKFLVRGTTLAAGTHDTCIAHALHMYLHMHTQVFAYPTACWGGNTYDTQSMYDTMHE